MINIIKRTLAVLGLISAAAFIGITVWLMATGQLSQRLDLILISLSCFLGFGLLSLGIRWLQDLKQKTIREANDKQDAQE